MAEQNKFQHLFDDFAARNAKTRLDSEPEARATARRLTIGKELIAGLILPTLKRCADQIRETHRATARAWLLQDPFGAAAAVRITSDLTGNENEIRFVFRDPGISIEMSIDGDQSERLQPLEKVSCELVETEVLDFVAAILQRQCKSR